MSDLDYSRLLADARSLFPNFDSYQAESAEAAWGMLRGRLEASQIERIVDLGCGNGEILLLRPPEVGDIGDVELIGLDSDEGVVVEARSRCHGAAAAKFINCDENKPFYEILSSDNDSSNDGHWSRTAVMCLGHTLFHLNYLDSLFENYKARPDDRPTVWVIDAYHTWDETLQDVKKGKTVYEPKSVSTGPDGELIATFLFTELLDESRVRRGLVRDASVLSHEAPHISTVQRALSTKELGQRFLDLGYTLEEAKLVQTGWGPMLRHLFALPRISMPVPELILGPKFSQAWPEGHARSADRHSPLPFVRDWIRIARALETGGIRSILFEFVPFHDERTGRLDLTQELLLVSKNGEDAEREAARRVSVYNSIAKSFQGRNMGMFLHDFVTGFDLANTNWRETVRISHSVHGGGIWDIPEEWKSNAWIEFLDESETSLEVIPDDHGAFVAMSRKRIPELGAEISARRIEAARTRSRERGTGREAMAEDYGMLLDIYHLALRRELGLGDARRSVLISSPLRVAGAGDDNELIEDIEVPKSYRGGVWIFAEFVENFGVATTDPFGLLRELVKVSLLEGAASVEAVVSDALGRGVRESAERTASIAVMSRNLSHNIGSHVLSSVIAEGAGRHDLMRLLSDPDFEMFVQMVQVGRAPPGERGVTELIVDWSKRAPHPILSYIGSVETGSSLTCNLIRYLQERMDFLGEISTGASYSAVSLTLKEVLHEFIAQKYLLSHISGIADDSQSSVRAQLDIAKSNIGILGLFPGGRNGCHALYTVLENVIRNSAKHRPFEMRNDEVKVGVRVDPKGGLLRLRVWDFARNAHEVKAGKPLVDHLNSVISSGPLVDVEGNLKRGNWGIREVMMAAAYLRDIPVEDAANGADPPLLQAVAVNGGGSKPGRNLGYELFLERPKLVTAFLDPGDVERLATIRKALEEQGVTIGERDASNQGQGRIPHKYLVGGSRGSVFGPVQAVGDGKALVEVLLSEEAPADAARKAWEWAAEHWLRVVASRHGIVASDADPATVVKTVNKMVEYVRHHTDPDFRPAFENKNLLFVESYDYTYEQRIVIQSIKQGKMKRAGEAELLSAALSRIVVLDERVQSAIDKHPGHWGDYLSMREAVERRRIEVPGNECPLDSVPSLPKIMNYLGSLDGVLDFVVVHLAVLERVVSFAGGDGVVPQPIGWREALRVLRVWAAKRERGEPEIVICSGRGVNEVIEEEVRFVPASQVDRYTVQVPSKYHLYQLLVSSRMPLDRKHERSDGEISTLQ